MIKFLDDNSIFNRSNQLLKGIIYTDSGNEGDFIWIKSKFKDPWYNFIIPIVPISKFGWIKAEKIITEGKKQGFEMSFYVHDSLLSEYKGELLQKGYKDFGTDIYMQIELKEVFKNITSEFVSLNQKNLEEYLKMTVDCFSTWENERVYSEYFYKLTQEPSDNTHITVLLKIDNELVSFGSVIIAKKLGLAYLHNLGTPEQHRRKGYASSIIKFLCNKVLQSSVREVYALLEDGSDSYHCFKRLNFEPKETFHLFVK